MHIAVQRLIWHNIVEPLGTYRTDKIQEQIQKHRLTLKCSRLVSNFIVACLLNELQWRQHICNVIQSSELAFFFISISTHIAAELNSGNMGINFSYWTPHGLLWRWSKVRSRQPAPWILKRKVRKYNTSTCSMSTCSMYRCHTNQPQFHTPWI
jgi:hypothetical protein